VTLDLEDLTITPDGRVEALTEFLAQRIEDRGLARRSAVHIDAFATNSLLPITLRNMETGEQFKLQGPA
jgi:hypothetical protein